MNRQKKYFQVGRHKLLTGFLCLLALCVWAQNKSNNQSPPQTFAEKGKQDNPNKVYLEFAEMLKFDEEKHADFQLLIGDVRFRKDSMFMYCDSAYFYEKTNSLDAFGNVRMEQGDTLFVYGDFLYYDGNTDMARLRENVRMENRDVILYTDSLNYDKRANIGYYFDGGKIVDSENELTSIYGQYSPDTKRAIFNYDVKLVNEQYTLYSDTLEYSTATKIADILGPSTIVSDSNTIYSTRGWYNTATDISTLYDRSTVESKGQFLTGDTIFYDRKTGFGEVFGNMFLNDTTRKVIMEGQYGYYNEKTEYSFATDSARVIEYSGVDSLFLHADTLRSYNDSVSRILQAYHGVRFFRNASQGVCDSLVYITSDSVLYMMQEPILWNENYQIYGDTIKVFMNDSTIERAHIPHFAFATQQKDSSYFDQLSGKDLKAYFDNGLLRKIDVSGNVQTIFYPEERDSTLIGLNKAESSFMTIFLKDQKMEKLIMWPAAQGVLTPIIQIRQDMLFLPRFFWYDYIRPKDKWDIYRKIEKRKEDSIKKTRRFDTEYEE